LSERLPLTINVRSCLTERFTIHGPPEHIRSDNGSKFTAKAVRCWLGRIGVQTLYIEPGSPWENRHYNTVRPHSSLGYRPPAPETILPPAFELSYASLRPAQTLALERRILT